MNSNYNFGLKCFKNGRLDMACTIVNRLLKYFDDDSIISDITGICVDDVSFARKNVGKEISSDKPLISDTKSGDKIIVIKVDSSSLRNLE